MVKNFEIVANSQNPIITQLYKKLLHTKMIATSGNFYYHVIVNTNTPKTIMFKYDSLETLSKQLSKRFGDFPVDEIAKEFKTNHMTFFNDKIIFGKSRTQLEEYIRGVFGDRCDGCEEEEEDEELYINLTDPMFSYLFEDYTF